MRNAAVLLPWEESPLPGSGERVSCVLTLAAWSWDTRIPVSSFCSLLIGPFAKVLNGRF